MVNKRLNQILELLIVRKKIEVVELSEILKVSQVTIRKDLTKLENTGMIRREHGSAVIQNIDDISGRLAYHYDSKKRIARTAMKLIKDGDTIMLESGSCCAILANELAETKQNLTIITNSAYIANSLRRIQNSFQIILLGGIYQQNSECLVGPMISSNAANFNVEYFFIGTDGYTTRSGFSNKDQMRAQAVRDMANFADKVVIVSESEKFKIHGTVPLNIPNQPQLVITDDQIPDEFEQELIAKNIKVIKAK